jgi:hypothetical protein
MSLREPSSFREFGEKGLALEDDSADGALFKLLEFIMTCLTSFVRSVVERVGWFSS